MEWLYLDGHCVGKVQMVVVLWVLDPPYIHLDGCKLILPRQLIVQKGAPCGFINCVLKLALRKCPKPAKSPFWREFLTVMVLQ